MIMKRKIHFATGNPNKVKEIHARLGDSYQVLCLSDLNYRDDIIEDGDTLEANALIKARTIYELFGEPTLAEDTGLEIYALDMKPGVRTARFAGESKDPVKNMNRVLELLVGKPDRRARFRAIIAFIENDQEYLFEGIVEGSIALEKMGTEGFGYDPIFIPDGYDKTFGELGFSVKREISHRIRAINKWEEHIDRRDLNK